MNVTTESRSLKLQIRKSEKRLEKKIRKLLKEATPFLLIVGLAVLMFSSPVNAEVFSKTYEDYQYDYYQGYSYTDNAYEDYSTHGIAIMFTGSWGNYKGLSYTGFETNSYVVCSGSDVTTTAVQLQAGGTTYGTGTATIIKQYNPTTSAYTGLKMWIQWSSFNTDKLITDGVALHSTTLNFDGISVTSNRWGKRNYWTEESGETSKRLFLGATISGFATTAIPKSTITTAHFNVVSFTIDYELNLMSDYEANRVNYINIDSDTYIRVTGIHDDTGTLMFNSYESGEREYPYHLLPLNVSSYLPDGQIVYDIIGEGIIPSNTVSVITRVKSLADSSLIAGSTVYYRALDGSDLVNQTLPSGSDDFLLTKNIWYEYWAEASGYENQTSTPSQSMFTGDTYNDIYLVPTVEEPGGGSGLYNFYISEQTNAVGSSTPLTSPATVVLNGETKLTTSSGYVSFEINTTVPITYKITKSGYESVTRSYTPSWPGNTINEFISLRPEGVILPGEPTPTTSPGDTPPTSSDIPAHRQAAHDSMEELNGIIPGIVSIVAIMFLVAVMKRGMK
ncbi:hypothetical protein [Methanoplanus endosymbiosus]|uniref:Uncharacterized protein n=1 Tax=Methanoplanus endosymbiosus TaxID=33865 RepID=A0A9E7PLF2_9EURY|nr:hypothetical protein [Methanoplanus endosymbiosus]UUX92080.1 hypothetical protein L6E24_12055 [Methanoplanus endosymbiosus]